MKCFLPALQIMMLNNGCMCCTVKEDLLNMLFELVSGLNGGLCLAGIKVHLLPLCLQHACLLLTLEVPHHVLGSILCSRILAVGNHRLCLYMSPVQMRLRLLLAVSLCAQTVCTDLEPLVHRHTACLLSQACRNHQQVAPISGLLPASDYFEKQA